MWFQLDNATLDACMALTLALTGAGLPAWLERRRSGAWSLVLPLSIVVTVAVIGLVPASADVYTWAALLLVPVGCALALGWAMHGARAALALGAAPLLAVAWIWPDDIAGQLARDLLIVGSCVTLGRLIAGSAPLTIIKLGLIAMAVVDAILVFSNTLEGPNATLVAAQPAPGLPQLQSGALNNSSLGYGDFLAAGVLGGIIAAERGRRLPWALALLAAGLLWNQLFLVTDVLPATVPVALVLLLREGLNRRMLRAVSATALLTLLLAPAAFGQAGSGSSGFGGGGGGGFSGGGGGFSGGGGSSTTSGGDAIIILLVVLFFAGSMILAAIKTAQMRRKRRQRVERIELAAAEAAADDEAFDADHVRERAAELFLDVQKAWDARDVRRLGDLVGDDLMVEWERRLKQFERKGWHQRVKVHNRPEVEYIGMVNRTDDADDRVTVRLEATLEAYVETKHGGRIMQQGKSSTTTALAEYWTLEKRENDRWALLSIEQDAEGLHHLDAEIVASPWGDDERLQQEAIAEGAAANAAPADVSPGELVDLDFSGPVRAQAMDLALADGRFDVDLIEASVRRAVAAWAEAVDGDDAALEAAAQPGAVRALLGDGGGRTRIVVRGPDVQRVTISALDAAATPPALTVDLDVEGVRYVEDRDTVALVSGNKTSRTRFTERWTLALVGEGEWPWRIAATTGASAA